MWAFIFLLLLPTTAMASGSVTGVLNMSRVIHEGTEGASPVREGDAVHLSDDYQTDPDAKLRILLTGETVFTLGAKSRFQIVENTYGDPELQQPRRFTGNLSDGIVRALVGPDFSQGASFTIETPTASVAAAQGWSYFIVWLTECDGKPATGILTLDGQVIASPKGQPDSPAVLSASFYTKMGAACPPPLPKAVSREVMAEVTGATAMADPVRSVAMEIDEPIVPESGRTPMAVRLLPPIVQTPDLSALTRVRVHVVFP